MKYISSFQDKLNENKLFIEDTFSEDVKWEQTINISSVWKEYENGNIDIVIFNNKLASELEKNLQNIEPFNKVINDLKIVNSENKSTSIWNKLYDIADQNLVQLL